MRTFRIRTAMMITAVLGTVLWLLRDYPLVLFFVVFFAMFLSPTFILTQRFLRQRAELGRRVSLAERLSAWLLVSSVVIPLEIMSSIAVMALLGLVAALVGWITSHSIH
jgi:hypothetical protein